MWYIKLIICYIILLGIGFIGKFGLLYAENITFNLPEMIDGKKAGVVSLNGSWDFQYSSKDKWEKVMVPGELVMQGYGIEHDKFVKYKKTFIVPSSYQGKEVILRFDGVYSYARLWVNGGLITEHYGGFTRWEANITKQVYVGRKNEIVLEVMDCKDDISYASGYAHHPIGGILRDVTLFTLPRGHMQNFYVETLLDSLYTDATLHLSYYLTSNANVSFYLKNEKDSVVFSATDVAMSKGLNEHSFQILAPKLWDAEHPYLYTLHVHIKSNSGYYSFIKEIGFRKVEIIKDKMLVNGKQVKLRGACRHDIHPTLGRSTTKELDSLDVTLFKQANMNFVRTSHYPPTENFLKYCDRLGLYVECETAVCFVNTNRQKNYAPGNSQNDTSFTNRYLRQLEEMVSMSRSHASVLFWSIGNESEYGSNFQLSYDWLKEKDKTRPVIFSYPGLVKEGNKVYDILSMHYPGCEGNLTVFNASTVNFQGEGIPALFDEWAHVPCYTYATLQDDPNIRDFWAISLDKMWTNLFEAPGGLGGAVWCYSDETFMIPKMKKGDAYWIDFARTNKPEGYRGNCVGYGEWGIVDVWRRKKPEFWGTKKAYSPIKILENKINEYVRGNKVLLPIYNRFDHTNLNEIRIRLTYKEHQYDILAPDLKPHCRGFLTLPELGWEEGENLLFEFFTSNNDLIDIEKIVLGDVKIKNNTEKVENRPLTICEDEKYIRIKGAEFEIPFNKHTGLMENVLSRGVIVIEKGPFLNLNVYADRTLGYYGYCVDEQDWVLVDLKYKQMEDKVNVWLAGKYLEILLNIHFIIDSSGKISINYYTIGEKQGWIKEVGLKFYLADNFDSLKWKRKGYWSYYPDNSLSGISDEVPLYNAGISQYGKKPQKEWNMDTHNYFYFSDKGAICENPLTNIAKAMKENIYEYIIRSKMKNVSLNIISNRASLGCRLNKMADEKLLLFINNKWDYPEIGWGNFRNKLRVSPISGDISLYLE